MLVAWSLFTTWLVFNLADIVISWMAAQFGAIEVELLYQISGYWQGLTSNKMMLALLIGGVLVYAKRNDLLALLNVYSRTLYL